MSTIHELPEEVRSKIAAGEVIERPAYIVKELLENSIDAGAKKISVKAEGGGISKIIVIDDGKGMDREDLALCYKPFATSKIYSFEDLLHVLSMGFRGEALASIAAVSTLFIRSRTNTNPFGNELCIERGKVVRLSKKGMPMGTQVIVDHIFESVPARQKFITSIQSEYRLLTELITRYSLSYPHIEFEFVHDGKRILSYQKDQKKDRIKEVVGDNAFEFLLPFSYTKDHIQLDGFISKPQLSYSSTRNQYHFINNRFIHESSITATIKEAYSTLLEPARHPFTVLYITIPPQYVDVNIHPRKERVHFLNEKFLHEVLSVAIKEVLLHEKVYFYDQRWEKNTTEKSEQWQIREGGTNTYAAQELKKEIPAHSALLNKDRIQDPVQFHNVYIILETDKGFLFIDQHAAHERILYEKLMESYNKKFEKGVSFLLQNPIPIQLNPIERTVIEEYSTHLQKIGFQFVLDKSQIQMVSIPELWKDREIKGLMRGLIDDLTRMGERMSIDTFSKKMIAYIACRSAIKAGDSLMIEEMKQLLHELHQTENQITCPHGRPIQIEMPLSYMHKRFKRI